MSSLDANSTILQKHTYVYVYTHERIRSACCDHYENKALLSIKQHGFINPHIRLMKTSGSKRPKLVNPCC